MSAATILLRCIVESADVHIKKDCALRLLIFQNRLEAVRETSEWDLADFCLERCSQPIEKIAAALKVSNNNEPDTGPVDAQQNSFGNSLSMPSSELDFSFPPDWLDLPWEPTWDMVEGGQPLS